VANDSDVSRKIWGNLSIKYAASSCEIAGEFRRVPALIENRVIWGRHSLYFCSYMLCLIKMVSLPFFSKWKCVVSPAPLSDLLLISQYNYISTYQQDKGQPNNMWKWTVWNLYVLNKPIIHLTAVSWLDKLAALFWAIQMPQFGAFLKIRANNRSGI